MSQNNSELLISKPSNIRRRTRDPVKWGIASHVNRRHEFCSNCWWFILLFVGPLNLRITVRSRNGRQERFMKCCVCRHLSLCNYFGASREHNSKTNSPLRSRISDVNGQEQAGEPSQHETLISYRSRPLQNQLTSEHISHPHAVLGLRNIW